MINYHFNPTLLTSNLHKPLKQIFTLKTRYTKNNQLTISDSVQKKKPSYLCSIRDGCDNKVRWMINKWRNDINSDIDNVGGGSGGAQLATVMVYCRCHQSLRWHCRQVLIGRRIIRKHSCVWPRTFTNCTQNHSQHIHTALPLTGQWQLRSWPERISILRWLITVYSSNAWNVYATYDLHMPNSQYFMHSEAIKNVQIITLFLIVPCAGVHMPRPVRKQ